MLNLAAEAIINRNIEKHTSRTFIKPSDPIISNLKELFDEIDRQAPQYCHIYHTCYSESLWNLVHSLAAKRVHYWKYYGLRCLIGYLQNNLGKEFHLKLLEKLLGLFHFSFLFHFFFISFSFLSFFFISNY